MKLVLSDIAYLKKSIDIIHGLVIEARFNITKDGISLVSMDPAGVCFIYFNIQVCPGDYGRTPRPSGSHGSHPQHRQPAATIRPFS